MLVGLDDHRDAGSSEPLGTRLKLIWADSLAACGAAVVIAAPTLLLRQPEVVDELRNVAEVYSGSKTTTTYWQELVKGREVGIPILVVLGDRIAVHAPVAQVAVRCRSAGLSSPSCSILSVVLVLLPAFSQPAAARALPRRRRGDRHRRDCRSSLEDSACLEPVPAGLALSLSADLRSPSRLVSGGAQQYYFDSRIDLVNSRVEAWEYLARHVQPGDEVLVADELAFVPNEIARIPGVVTTKSLADPLDPEEAATYDYVVVGGFAAAESWRPELQSRRKIIQLGRRATMTENGSFRPPDQIIRVFGAPDTGDPAECFPFCG